MFLEWNVCMYGAEGELVKVVEEMDWKEEVTEGEMHRLEIFCF